MGLGAPSAGQRRKRRIRSVVLLLTVPVGLLLAEGLLRWLLFSPSALAARLGAGFRQPGLYVAGLHSDDFTKLNALFLLDRRPADEPEPFPDAPFPDVDVGWLKADIDPDTYRHADEGRIEGRRPVLFLGSSYGACAGHDGACFEQLLAASELGARFALLNYAVNGHGIDQSLLLLRKCLDHHAGNDPLVVLAFAVESDLERAVLSFFSRPKPRFRAQAGGYALELPDELDVAKYLARHPPTIRSYFWRYLQTGLGVPPETRRRWEGLPERGEELRPLIAFLVGEFARECAARGLERFVLLFHTEWGVSVAPQPVERELAAGMVQFDLPWVDSRADVERVLRQEGVERGALFGPSGHPSPRGTEVLFEALARGLRGEYDGGRPSR